MTVNRFTRFSKFLAAVVGLTAAGKASAMSVDIIDASNTPGPNSTFFAPAGMHNFIPFYRYEGEDWTWSHIGTGMDIVSATLSITAWDVDNPAVVPAGNDPEIDQIGGFKGGAWTDIGLLEGQSNEFSVTSFVLDSSWFSDIQSGLMLGILIDQDDTDNYDGGNFFYGVSLIQSKLTLEFRTPAEIPLPAAAWLFGTALLGLAGIVRRRKRI